MTVLSCDSFALGFLQWLFDFVINLKAIFTLFRSHHKYTSSVPIDGCPYSIFDSYDILKEADNECRKNRWVIYYLITINVVSNKPRHIVLKNFFCFVVISAFGRAPNWRQKNKIKCCTLAKTGCSFHRPPSPKNRH